MQIDFYTQIHKALRRWLFNLAIEIGTTDFTDSANRQKIQQQLLQLTALLRAHAKHEAKFLHPLIYQKLKNEAATLNKEHATQEQWLDKLEKLTPQSNVEGLALYQEFNRFIADYLHHLNEEEALMPLLNQLYSQEELLVALMQLINSLTKPEIMESIKYMLPALNPEERNNYMRGLLMNASREEQESMRSIAAQALKTY